METSVGEPLISMRPFAIRKWSDWLVSNEFPCLPSSLPSYTKAATISYRAPSRRLLTDSTQKTLGLQKPYVPNIVGRQNVQECLHMVKWGVQRVASEPPRASGCYTMFSACSQTSFPRRRIKFPISKRRRSEMRIYWHFLYS